MLNEGLGMLMGAVAALSSPPEYLTMVQSEPVPAEGTASEIASRGEACIGDLYI